MTIRAEQANPAFDHEETVTVSTEQEFITEGIQELYLKSDTVFGVATSSGAFTFNTTEVHAKGIELIDFKIINYGKRVINVEVKWNNI